MTDDERLMQQALEALECPPEGRDMNELALQVMRVTAALRERLAQPEQEPVAWLTPKTVDSYMRPDLGYETCSKTEYAAFPVYTTPPRREWVGLTEEEKKDALVSVDPETKRLPPGFRDFAQAIEAKLKEKNNE